jgi:glycerate 2-kinase
LVEGCPIVTAGTAAIPRHVLLVCEPFNARLSAAQVAEAIAAGLRGAGTPTADALGLPACSSAAETAALLDAEGFDARMHTARAVVLAVAALSEETLAGSAAFEVATRARQRGVPCYAIAAAAGLDRFDLRILDLQIVLEARSTSALRGAGERLATLL